ncbi:hypothetical protein E3N88_34510 [Mikania micrantha]|uniref:ABC1 atypical kinase-like domain-containing protein n=1 Tax=Mikania micrantha TaxID=192012 RepID=A0A5N6LYC2_9ASTR|nr:hypothetical protein E3N88_34510 [Mikania micrantha]
MEAILACSSCYSGDVRLVNQGRKSMLDRHECTSLKIVRTHRFHVEMQQTESPMKFGANVQPSKLDTNGQPVKLGANGKPVNLATNAQRMKLGSRGQPITMVPISEVVNNKHLSKQRSGTSIQINGTNIEEEMVLSNPINTYVFHYGDPLKPFEATHLWGQDRVPAFAPEKAKGCIEKELGAPVDVLFKEFEEQPIAAASLGQVHRAILHNGEKVIVKVQRPGLKKLFDIDLRNLKLILEYFQRNETLGGPTKDWIGIYNECEKILYQEIDYINEGKNADRFRRDFRNIKWVRVPQVFWDYTATKVLTMEFVPGIKINNLEAIKERGYNRSRISSHAIESYLIQILKTGFFHADPHPGNLAIDVDESLIYYDFGMMGEIKSFTREKLMDLFYAIYEKDAKKVMNSLISLEALQPTGDISSVRRSIQFFLDNSLNQSPDHKQTLAAIGEDLFSIATDQPFQFPSTFAFIIRAFSTLEGVGYSLDPKFSFVKIATPYVQKLLDPKQEQPSGTQLVAEMQKQANDARSNTISMPYRVQRIEEFVKQLEVGDLKLRVRVLESERAAQKATNLQMATLHTVITGTLINIGVTFSTAGSKLIANGSFVAAGVIQKGDYRRKDDFRCQSTQKSRELK